MIAPASSYLVARQAGASRLRWQVRPRTAAAIALVSAAVIVEISLAAPYLGRAGSALTRLHPLWLALALAAEVGSMVSFGRLQRVMLGAGGVRVRLRHAVATVLAGNAMSVTLPGGSVLSLVYTMRRMRSWGASTSLATFALTAAGLLSTLAFTVLAATAGALGGSSVNPGVVALVVAGVLAGVLAAALVVRLVGRRPELVESTLARVARRVRRRRGEKAGRATAIARGARRAGELLAELRAIHPSRKDWARGLGFAAANWVDDLLCLFGACLAVDVSPSLSVLLLAYAAGMATASVLSVLPGGVGAVEAAMIVTLVHGGAHVGRATAAVLLYRIISFVLVALAGWVTLLAVGRRRAGQRADQAGASCAGYSVRSSCLRTLPTAVRGNSATNEKYLGIL